MMLLMVLKPQLDMQRVSERVRENGSVRYWLADSRCINPGNFMSYLMLIIPSSLLGFP